MLPAARCARVRAHGARPPGSAAAVVGGLVLLFAGVVGARAPAASASWPARAGGRADGAAARTPGPVPVVAAARGPVRASAPDPLGGLLRWDGSTFHAVAARSVRGGRVHILVPAGVPAGISAAERAGLRDLARSFGAAEPAAVVLAYRWEGRGGASESEPGALADLNGQRLARAWERASAPGFAARGGMLHIVGDGPGSRVAVVAAQQVSPAPDQVTLLGSDERPASSPPGRGGRPSRWSANRLAGYLPRLAVGRAPGTTRVDSYDAGLGEDYGDDPGLASVVDVRLLPPAGARSDEVARRYPLRWYTASVRDRGAGVGWAWSPLAGGSFRGLAPAYRQSRPGRAADPVPAADLALVARPRGGARPVVSAPLAVYVRRGPPARNPAAAAAVIRDGGTWTFDLATGRADLGVGFDYRFLRGGAGSALTVRLDGARRAVVDGGYAGAAGQRIVLDVAGLPPGAHTVSVELSGPGRAAGDGAPRAAVAVADIRALRRARGPVDRRPGPAALVGAVVAAALLVVAGLAGTVAATRARPHSREVTEGGRGEPRAGPPRAGDGVGAGDGPVDG